MKALRNLGHHERIIRVSIGLVLLALSGFSMLPGVGRFVAHDGWSYCTVDRHRRLLPSLACGGHQHLQSRPRSFRLKP